MGLVTKDDGWRISDELWEKIEPLLPQRPSHPLGCHRSRVPDRAAMNAILLVLRTGMQWNALSATGICSSSSAHRRFLEWTEAGVFREFWRQSLLDYQVLKGIDWDWLAMDGAMTKAPLGGEKTGPNPTDRGKEGTKRSTLTDAAGMPIAMEVAGANRHDMKLTRATLSAIVIPRPIPIYDEPQRLCLDKGFDYDEVRDIVLEFGFTAHIRTRGEEAKAMKKQAGFKARRWVVERTHSWLNRFRRLLVRWEKRADTYLAMLHLACGLVVWRSNSLMG
ncbi:IS5 family transposase [Azohydromonas caseinilytica]|uniref:IS5 family transposase n=1 Tax=Azohydromonas caseinilytica TaxID=2728836 RepID=UPI00197C8459